MVLLTLWLKSEYQTFDNSLNLYATAILIVAGYNQLANGTISLVSGSSTLKDGTAKLRSATTGLDTKVKDKINDLIKEIEFKKRIVK